MSQWEGMTDELVHESPKGDVSKLEKGQRNTDCLERKAMKVPEITEHEKYR